MKKYSIQILILIVVIISRPAMARFDDDRAFADLVKQVDFGPRNPGSKGHKLCLNFLKTELEKSAAKVTLQSFDYNDHVHSTSFRLTNLIASFNPDNKDRIFLAAHWDTRPGADYEVKEKRHIPIPGANDGASGVAVLLEIGRQLKLNPPAIGVDLILFDGEDYGREGHLDEYFLGSRYFAKNAGNYKPRYGVLLDMIGDANLNIPREAFSNKYLPHIVDKVWQIAHSMGYWEFEDRVGHYVSDDHTVLVEHGIPCIDIIDFEYPDQSHRYWHTLQDTPDKCSPRSLGIIGRVMLELIYGEQ